MISDEVELANENNMFMLVMKSFEIGYITVDINKGNYIIIIPKGISQKKLKELNDSLNFNPSNVLDIYLELKNKSILDVIHTIIKNMDLICLDRIPNIFNLELTKLCIFAIYRRISNVFIVFDINTSNRLDVSIISLKEVKKNGIAEFVLKKRISVDYVIHDFGINISFKDFSTNEKK